MESERWSPEAQFRLVGGFPGYRCRLSIVVLSSSSDNYIIESGTPMIKLIAVAVHRLCSIVHYGLEPDIRGFG